jgi:hypothetical protein
MIRLSSSLLRARPLSPRFLRHFAMTTRDEFEQAGALSPPPPRRAHSSPPAGAAQVRLLPPISLSTDLTAP